MKKRKAVITGITGQDGSYLAEHLLENDYEVFGTVRRNSYPEHQESRIHHILNDITLTYGDLTDHVSMEKVLKSVQPDEIYHLGAQSHVRISFDIPIYTVQTNVLGTMNLLEAYRVICPSAKFYQASSSEMFGNSMDSNGFQSINTPMNPVSPYGCTKVFGYNLVRNYRKSYNLFAVNGILFNHESPRRGTNFVTNKVVKAAVKIKCGLQKELALGNLDALRDWGHAKDYVKAMKMMLDYDDPADWVVATGISHSVRDLCRYVFGKLNLIYDNYITLDPKFLRPEELKFLKGLSTPIREMLGWTTEYTFETMLDEMIEYWKNYYKC